MPKRNKKRFIITVYFGSTAQRCHIQKSKSLENRLIFKAFFSRGDWIRTSDHTPPRRVL